VKLNDARKRFKRKRFKRKRKIAINYELFQQILDEYHDVGKIITTTSKRRTTTFFYQEQPILQANYYPYSANEYYQLATHKGENNEKR
jgi:hypothetical protein